MGTFSKVAPAYPRATRAGACLRVAVRFGAHTSSQERGNIQRCASQTWTTNDCTVRQRVCPNDTADAKTQRRKDAKGPPKEHSRLASPAQSPRKRATHTSFLYFGAGIVRISRMPAEFARRVATSGLTPECVGVTRHSLKTKSVSTFHLQASRFPCPHPAGCEFSGTTLDCADAASRWRTAVSRNP